MKRLGEKIGDYARICQAIAAIGFMVALDYLPPWRYPVAKKTKPKEK
jgi:hypothetical protein